MTVSQSIRGALALSVLCCFSACPGNNSGMSAGAAGGAAEAAGGASLMEGAANCDQVKQPFMRGMQAMSADGSLVATIVDANPNPPQKYENSWTVQFTTPDGQPAGTLTSVKGFMPAHGHDTKKPPVVNPTGDPSTYKVDVLNLWMSGAWTVTFTVDMGGKSEEMVFWVCIP